MRKYTINWKKNSPNSFEFQEAIAIAFEAELKRLDSPQCYFNAISVELKEKRDFMSKFLSEVGMKPIIPQGGYFMIADWSALGELSKYLFIPKSLMSHLFHRITFVIIIASFYSLFFNRKQSRLEYWVRSTTRLSFHKMDDQKCWPTGHSTISFLQRDQQISDGEICTLLLLQKRRKFGEGRRYFEKLG